MHSPENFKIKMTVQDSWEVWNCTRRNPETTDREEESFRRRHKRDSSEDRGIEELIDE